MAERWPGRDASHRESGRCVPVARGHGPWPRDRMHVHVGACTGGLTCALSGDSSRPWEDEDGRILRRGPASTDRSVGGAVVLLRTSPAIEHMGLISHRLSGPDRALPLAAFGDRGPAMW
ncbi:hypothetical protein CDD83_10608 [Cordyceps sp. RAO-2017]|nr:hypothetical protein CDD83_10608 [Cordyceps sp. RAO-2017]